MQILLISVFPFFFEFILKFYLGLNEFHNIWAPILMSFCIFSGLILANNKQKFAKKILFFVFYIPAFVNIAHILLLNSDFSHCSFLVLFETNFNEAIEFLAHAISSKFLIFSAIYWLLTFFIFKQTRPLNFTIHHKKLLICFFIISYGISAFGDFRYRFPLEKFTITYAQYVSENTQFKKLLKDRSNFKFLPIKSYMQNQKQTYVIVIGESASRSHLELYGAKTPTNPKLKSIVNELSIFNDVNSVACITRKALLPFLCLNSKFTNGDIITYLKQSGFKTFWFSNQYTAGNHDSFTTMIVRLSDNPQFINKSHYRTTLTSSFDEALIPSLKKALSDPSEKKVIFLHTMGSHLTYKKRSPEKYKIFKAISKTKHSEEVAEYNNSILYTDSILFEIINLVKKLDETSAVLYFSDHGEDVTEDPKSPHMHCEALATKPMFEIPFFAWLSDKYKNQNQKFITSWDLKKHHTTENFMLSVLNFMRLYSDDFDEKLSIFGGKK